MKFIYPEPLWYYALPIIMHAFHNIPDLEDFPIQYWIILYDSAKEIMEKKL